MKNEISFLDYIIRDCQNKDGIVLYKKGDNAKNYECHLGNYGTLEDAKQAAVYFFMIARPNEFATHIYHYLIDSGTWGERKILMGVIKREGIEVPKELEADLLEIDLNFPITFNGKKLRDLN